VHLVNYPEHASTAREMEEAACSLFPTEKSCERIIELARRRRDAEIRNK
jgi:hypothetical protein